MDKNLKRVVLPPPDPNDHNSWQDVVEKNLHLEYDAQVLFCALQGLGAKANGQVRNALAKQLSDLVISMLRRKVSRYHPNEGEDIILRAHEAVFVAAAKPNSSDGAGFREAFYARLKFRLIDAIDKEYQLRRTEEDILAEKANKAKIQTSAVNDKSIVAVVGDEPIEDEDSFAELDEAVSFHEPAVNYDDEAPPERASYTLSLLDGDKPLIEQMDVDRLLKKHIPNIRKRLAFRLFMDDVPYKTKRAKSLSIADAMGIDESTARAWIQEVKEILSEQVRRS
jgi:DNA-directed RNA polymerase specialized sigma24 family protein